MSNPEFKAVDAARSELMRDGPERVDTPDKNNLTRVEEEVLKVITDMQAQLKELPADKQQAFLDAVRTADLASENRDLWAAKAAAETLRTSLTNLVAEAGITDSKVVEQTALNNMDAALDGTDFFGLDNIGNEKWGSGKRLKTSVATARDSLLTAAKSQIGENPAQLNQYLSFMSKTFATQLSEAGRQNRFFGLNEGQTNKLIADIKTNCSFEAWKATQPAEAPKAPATAAETLAFMGEEPKLPSAADTLAFMGEEPTILATPTITTTTEAPPATALDANTDNLVTLTVEDHETAPAFTEYTVQKGDSLSKISKQFLHDGNRYMEIFNANTDQLKDPNKIKPGQKLKIPTGEQQTVNQTADRPKRQLSSAPTATYDTTIGVAPVEINGQVVDTSTHNNDSLTVNAAEMTGVKEKQAAFKKLAEQITKDIPTGTLDNKLTGIDLADRGDVRAAFEALQQVAQNMSTDTPAAPDFMDTAMAKVAKAASTLKDRIDASTGSEILTSNAQAMRATHDQLTGYVQAMQKIGEGKLS